MHCSIQEGCSTVHTIWNASPEDSEIPSISSPLLFLVFNLLCQEKDKSFIMLEVWPQTKLPKRCFRAFSTWACAISAGTWQAFPVTFAIIHKFHIPSVLLHKGSSFYSWLAPLHSLPLKPEAAELTLYKEFKLNSNDCSGRKYWVLIGFVTLLWLFLCTVVNGVFFWVCCTTCLRKAAHVRNFRMFLKVQQVEGREVDIFFVICIHTYITYILHTLTPAHQSLLPAREGGCK